MLDNIVSELREKSQNIKLDLLKLATAEVIHIGGDLSSADIMTAIWQYKMRYNPLDPKDESRDRFVLSKGHAMELLAFEQAYAGCYSKEEVLQRYCKDESPYTMHACNLHNPYIEVSSGSLGHGIAVAAGMAQGLRLKGNNTSRVYVLMGDGEQSEGSVWEAAMNAAKHELGNLVVFIDNNNLEADGRFDQITSASNLKEKYEAFGWNAEEINGHDMYAIVRVLDSLPLPQSNKPTVIICHTIKGHGVSFMEDQPKWHAGKLTAEQHTKSMHDISAERSTR